MINLNVWSDERVADKKVTRTVDGMLLLNYGKRVLAFLRSCVRGCYDRRRSLLAFVVFVFAVQALVYCAVYEPRTTTEATFGGGGGEIDVGRGIPAMARQLLRDPFHGERRRPAVDDVESSNFEDDGLEEIDLRRRLVDGRLEISDGKNLEPREEVLPAITTTARKRPDVVRDDTPRTRQPRPVLRNNGQKRPALDSRRRVKDIAA